MFYTYSRNKGNDYIEDLLIKRFNKKAILGQERTIVFNNREPEDFDENEDETNTIIEKSESILKPEEITRYVNSLKRVSSYWYYSFNPNECKDLNEDEKLRINRLHRVGINYFRTTVVAAMMDNRSKPEEKVNLYKAIERFIFLCFRMAGNHSSYFSATGYGFGRQLLSKKITVSEVTEIINNKFNENVVWATNSFLNKIKARFKNNEGYYSWRDRKYFLFEYEAYLAKKYVSCKFYDWKTFLKDEKDVISIEHIFPQTPNNWYWQNQFRDYSFEEQKCFCNSLGNFLPLSKKINSSLQNQDFDTKKNIDVDDGRRGYKYGCHSESEVAQNDNWGPTEIKERGLKLLSFMEERWDFKFPESINKLELLGIPFVDDKRLNSPELPKNVSYDSEGLELTLMKESVDEYLKGKSTFSLNLYNQLFSLLKDKISDLVAYANKVYIGLRSQNYGINFANVWVQKSQLKVLIYTTESQDQSVGKQLPDSYRRSKTFSLIIKDETDIKNKISSIIGSYKKNNFIISKKTF